jgi:hypothetical protein
MLRSKKALLIHLATRVSCLFVVVALIGAPIEHTAHARTMDLAPERSMGDNSAPSTYPCEDSDRCKIVCWKGSTKLIGLRNSSPQPPDATKFLALPGFLLTNIVQTLPMEATCPSVGASHNQAAYLSTCRLRI